MRKGGKEEKEKGRVNTLCEIEIDRNELTRTQPETLCQFRFSPTVQRQLFFNHTKILLTSERWCKDKNQLNSAAGPNLYISRQSKFFNDNIVTFEMKPQARQIKINSKIWKCLKKIILDKNNYNIYIFFSLYKFLREFRFSFSFCTDLIFFQLLIKDKITTSMNED